MFRSLSTTSVLLSLAGCALLAACSSSNRFECTEKSTEGVYAVTFTRVPGDGGDDCPDLPEGRWIVYPSSPTGPTSSTDAPVFPVAASPVATAGGACVSAWAWHRADSETPPSCGALQNEVGLLEVTFEEGAFHGTYTADACPESLNAPAGLFCTGRYVVEGKRVPSVLFP